MLSMNYRQIKAIEQKNKQRFLEVEPNIPETSGVYILYRKENGFKYAYVGQAKHLLTRLAQHLSGYQHIDLSLKKHGLYNEDKPYGWKVDFITCDVEDLDRYEQHYIKRLANMGYQLRNKTSGSQGEGKQGLDNQKAPKGYYDGKKQGYLDARKFVANLFDKHLQHSQKSNKPNKNQEKALEKFKAFLDWSENG
ncbi:MAG: GIY-YIG nuclease family protein [Alphaproteobacteria bacterium]|nr:GIY-YIG nuclease family protein [Alphaproteobacteria bacterium]